jgi:hypothetical protein
MDLQEAKSVGFELDVIGLHVTSILIRIRAMNGCPLGGFAENM